MIESLDEYLLAVATKVAHRLQRLTGLTTYFIARVGVLIATASLIVDCLNYFHQFLVGKTTAGGLGVSAICLFIFVYYSIVLRQAEESVGSNIKPIALIPFITHESCGWRIFWLVMFVGEIILFCRHHSPYTILEFLDGPGFPLGLVIFNYFVKVDPLPPGKSKIREWIENFMPVPQLAEQ